MKVAAFEVHRAVVMVVDACPSMEYLLYCALLVACVVDPFLLADVVVCVGCVKNPGGHADEGSWGGFAGIEDPGYGKLKKVVLNINNSS